MIDHPSPAGGWRDAAWHGFSLSIAASLFLVIIPPAIATYIQLGLSDWNLAIAAGAIPMCFLAVLVVLVPPGRAGLSRLVTSVSAGAIAVAAGLSWFVDLSDRDATVSIALLSVAMAALFMASLVSFLQRRAVAPASRDGTAWQERVAAVLGTIIVPVVAAPFLLLPRGHGIALIVTGAAALLLPLAPGTGNATDHAGTPVDGPRVPRPHLVPVLLDMLVATFLITGAVTGGGSWVLVVAGTVAGFVVSSLLAKRAVMLLASKALLVLAILTFTLDPTPLRAAWIGIVPGHLLATLVTRAGGLPRGKNKTSTGWVLFTFMLVTVGGSGLGSYTGDIVADPALLVVMTSAGAGLLLVSTILDVHSWHRVDGVLRLASRRAWPARGRASKAVKIAVMAALVTAPVVTGIGIANASLSVTIHLPVTMYDVHGAPVTSVVLGPSAAKILFTSPHPTATGHETIRPGKSVRLGGYYYGYGENYTKADVIDWIGHTNDVYSFGFMGTGGNQMTAANLSAIKGINPDGKFYYMAFATTLYETSAPAGHGPAWGNSHYPTVQFNDTIHDMTLKLANGSEARGVRREPTRDDAHLMDLGNMAWAEYFAWIYENRSLEFHADGVAIDEVMWRGYWNVERWNGGVPLRDYQSQDEIIASCYAWLERIREKMTVEIITQAFWPAAMVHQDGVWGEIAFRAGGPYGGPVSDKNDWVWYEPLTWQGIVENARAIAGEGKSYIWAAWYEDGDERGLEYAIATYLMAKPNGCTSLAFQPHPGYYAPDLVGYAVQRVAEEVARHEVYFDMELGNATGEMVLKQGAGGQYWQRDFDNGMVLVNPFQARLFRA